MKHVPYYILGSSQPRPDSKRSIFVDGVSDNTFRAGTDLELSHWSPNKTPQQHKAGTSTEICFKYLEDQSYQGYDLVLNNHLDIDGLLSVFTMTHPELALANRDVLITAAEMGDFWGYGSGKALQIFQEITPLFKENDSGWRRMPFPEQKKITLDQAYVICIDNIIKILNGNDPIKRVTQEAESILHSTLDLVDQGIIERTVYNDNFVSYLVSHSITNGTAPEFLVIPSFNEPITDRIGFWPQARNYFDKEKVQLVGIETPEGIYYDLYYPGYIWSDTKDLWRPPGLSLPHGGDDPFLNRFDALHEICESLDRLESATGHWVVFDTLGLFNSNNPRSFPVIMSFLDETQNPAKSNLGASVVAKRVAKIFAKWSYTEAR